MSRTPKRIPCPEREAEGLIQIENQDIWFPYDTQLAGPDGCSIHIWMGTHNQNSSLRSAAVRIAHDHRDIVEVTYSTGEPTNFWANQNMKGT